MAFTINHRYTIQRELSGDGQSSRVLLVDDALRGSQACALKLLRPMEERDLSPVRREFDMLRSLRHPLIAEVYDFGRVEEVDGQEAGPGGAKCPVQPGDLFITFSYIDGLDLRAAYLRLFPEDAGGSGPEPAGEEARRRWRIFYEALTEVALGLHAIHSRGLVHHDVKPQNLLLIPRGAGAVPEGFDIKIIDLDLARPETTPLGTRLRGTLPFVAPEVLSGSFADRRSDLYSLGISILWAMSGRSPFNGSSLEEVAQAIQAGAICPLPALCPSAPPEILAVIALLVHRESAGRLPDAMALVAELERIGSFSHLARPRSVRSSVPTVGWERELALLSGEIEALSMGESERSAVIVETSPESFVDQLLEEIGAAADLHQVRCLTGSARQPAHFPYQPVAEIVQELAGHLDLGGERYQRFGEFLVPFLPAPSPPGAVPSPLAVPSPSVPEGRFPEGKFEGAGRPAPRAAAGAESPEGAARDGAAEAADGIDFLPPLWKTADPVRERLRFFDGITEFLLEAGREMPLILLIRGLGRTDGETLELLEFIARNIDLRRRPLADDDGHGDPEVIPPPTAAPSRLLIIGEYEEAAPASAFDHDSPAEAAPGLSPLTNRTVLDRITDLASQPYSLKIKLKPLGQERIAEWIAQRCPGLSPSPRLVQRIHERCGGAPRLLDEIVRRLPGESARAGGAAPPRDQAGDDPEGALRLPDNLQDACLERLSRFGPADRFLLDLLAAAHAPVPFPVLCRIVEDLRERPTSGLPAEKEGGREGEVASRLRRLEDEGFLVLTGGRGEPLAGWAVEALRQAVYLQLPEEKRSRYHRAILEALVVGRPPAWLSEELAFHALRAGLVGSLIRFGPKAVGRYLRAHAAEPAIRLLEEILGAVSSSGPLPPAAPGPAESLPAEALRWSILRELGEIYQGRRNFSRALEKYTVLLSLEESGAAAVQGSATRRAEVYRKMGEVYSENRDPANALFFLEKSLEVLADQPPGRERVESLLALAEFQLGRGQLQRAEAAAERALDTLERLKAPDLRSRTYSLLAGIASRQNDHARSLSWNQKALATVLSPAAPPKGATVPSRPSPPEGAAERLAELTGAIGENYLARGEYEKAIEHFNRAIDLARQVGSKHLQALFLNQLGTIHFNRANHFQALELFTRSLDLRRELGDQKGIANSYNNLGLVFRLRDELPRASECYKKSIDIFSRIDDHYGMAAGMNNLANILELEGKYNEALDYSFRSLEKRKRFNSKTGVAFSYYRIGKIYQSKGELDKALAFAEKSLAIRRELGEKMGIAFSHLQLSELFLLSGKLFDAFQECQRGQNEFKRVENDLGRMLAREILARILLQVGIFDEAAEILHETLAQAREGNQQLTIGAALMDLGRIGMEEGKLREAEVHLSRAEALFRDNHNRREHAEALLERCALTLELGHRERASEILEDAYGILEELGIRDLVPRYFLLRGRIESESPGGSSDRARKFLERGLVEAREIHLPDLSWQLHYRLAILLKGRGEVALARGHAREAETILAAQFEPLPLRFREYFYRTRDRSELLKLSGALAAPGLAPEPAPGPGAPAAPRQDGEVHALNKNLLKLQEISQAITSELDLHRLLEKLMDAVLELVNAERGFLLLRSPGGEPDTITVARNLDREMVDRPELKISRSITDEVIRTGRPVLSTSALEDERYTDSKSVHNLKLQSILCVPLIQRDQTLGAIYLDNRLRKHAFNEADKRLLTTFSAQAAIAITNARLSEEIQSRNRDLTEANRQMEILNQRLLRQVDERTAELKVAREHLRRRQTGEEQIQQFHNLVGRSKQVREIFHVLERISGTALPVLIMGESGTGKELVANAIHQSSTRREQRFISENCAALSETLLESELFGHTRGAFTGAVAERKGLFELAHGGTLFLDEVGDMSLAMQKKLLRVLEEGEIRRVGGKDTIKVDSRIISASNQNLKALVDAGKFREDLYYRLNGIRIELPPLRERKEDIPLLIQHFLQEISRESRHPVKTITPEALRLLLSYDWPGNVRELRHFLERTVLLSADSTIEERDCLFDPVIFRGEGGAATEGLLLDLEKLPLRQARDGFTRHYLARLYQEHRRNVSRAARASGISRESFHRLLKKLKINERGKPAGGEPTPFR